MLLLYYCYHISNVNLLLYLCATKYQYMNGKYIKIITFLGLLVIVIIQSVWLVKTYQLIELQLTQSGNRIFPKSVLNEVLERLSITTESYGEDKTLNLSTNMDYDENISDKTLKEHLISFLNNYADSLYQSHVSIQLLDSIFKADMKEEGYNAELYCMKVDSTGIPIDGEKKISGINAMRTIKTSVVALNKDKTECVQAVIVNPYWIAIREMSVLLIATALLICFVAGCIIYQIKIIIKQNKIAMLRQDFTYAMIHDMKTPINTITMAGHVLESGMMDSNPALKKQYFSILKEESMHLLNLAEKILTIAKIEQSRLKLNNEEIDLNSMFDELIQKFSLKSDKNVSFIKDVSIKSHLMADKEYLKEAISNLIDNSLKYSDEKVTVKLTAEENGSSILIKVRDDGWGIPLKEQKRIFEKFQRGGLEYRKGNKVSGFGLGLNYVYKVITAMNGSVSLNSIEGEYSEFILTLPIKN